MNTKPGILALDGDSNFNEAQEALKYFSILLADSEEVENTIKFTGINKFGIVELVGMTNDAGTANLNSVMEQLSNILIAAVLKSAGNVEQNQVDPKYWKEGFRKLMSLFFFNYVEEGIDYQDKKASKEIVEDVIKIGFDVSGEPSNPLKTAIEQYIRKQAVLMDKMGFDGKMNNPYTLFGFSNFVKAGARVCCIRAYFTNFDTQSVEITRCCRDSEKKFDYSFKVTHYNSNFMLSSWETDPEFQKIVLEFIDKHRPKDDPYFDTCETASKFKVS